MRNFRLHNADKYREFIEDYWSLGLKILGLILLFTVLVVSWGYLAFNFWNDIGSDYETMVNLEMEIMDLKYQLIDQQASIGSLELRILDIEGNK